MEVEAEVWYWWSTGMQQQPSTAMPERYVRLGDVERLLEEAHARGAATAADALAFDHENR